METVYRNYVKEVQDGTTCLQEAIADCNNLLVSSDLDEDTTSEEIEYLSSQIDRLNELCAEAWMKTQGYRLDSVGTYIKSENFTDYSDF